MNTITNLDIDKCLLCLEYMTDNIGYPNFCNCKIKIHIKCVKEIENNGLLCPICRKKPATTDKLSFLMYPYNLFTLNPNFLSFCIFLSWSFLVTIFYIIPNIIYQRFININYIIFIFNITIYSYMYSYIY